MLSKPTKKRLRKFAVQATQGAWHPCTASKGTCSCRLIWAGDGETVVAALTSGFPDETVRTEDWHFMAAASPSTVLALLDEIDDLRKRLAERSL